jgi:RNA polymerase sigma-70 factor (ECF subfamily)
VDQTIEAEVSKPSAAPGSTALPPSDEELARRAQGGCAASLDELVRRFQVPLLHFLLRWTSRDDAEDLVQDTLVRAYRNLHRYRPSRRFATWLFTIARRLSINQKRRRRPAADSGALESVADQTPGPGEVVAEQESRQCLWKLAAEVLTEPQMTATWLYYVEEMSVRQIARVLGRSHVAAKLTLFRARKKLLSMQRELDPAGRINGRDGAMNKTSCANND